MSSSSERRDSAFLPSATARGLSLAGLVLLVLFLTVLAGSLFPIKLLDPAWQLRLGSAIINSSPMPLTGLALLHLATALDLRDSQLVKRRQLASRLAIPVALGFLLLFPLLSTAALRQQSEQVTVRTSRVDRATRQLASLREAVRTATTVDDLAQRLSAVQGPELDANDRNQPLPVLKTRVNAALDRAAAQIERQRPSPTVVNPWTLLPEIARSGVACIALAIGFAGLARRPESEMSFLSELQATWQRRFGRRPGPRTSKRGVALPGDVFARLAERDDAPSSDGSGSDGGDG